MARMQKKKPVDAKKKRKDTGSSVSGSAQAEANASSISAASGSASGDVKVKKSKPALSDTRRTGRQQTAVMKLLDRYFGTWIQFLREVRMELAKVTWPTRKETIGTTAVVLIFVFIIALYLGIVDIGLSSIVRLIL